MLIESERKKERKKEKKKSSKILTSKREKRIDIINEKKKDKNE